MPVTVIVGCQWGDEGKGKIVDVLSGEHDIVARYQGGNNAGHTVIIHGEKYVLHTLPSGILHNGVTSVIGNGVVVDVLALIDEIDEIAGHGFDVMGNLVLSEQAHLILPQHGVLDRAREEALGNRKIGTTGRGIGFAYAEKMARRGLRACDLRDRDHFAKVYREFNQYTNEVLTRFFQIDPYDGEEMLERLMDAGQRLKPIIRDSVTLLNDAVAAGKDILAEGAQGVLLDVDHGTYPYVTSSSPAPGGACTGLGISPRHFTEIIGIVKAYTTRVGEGPMVTEELGEIGERLRSEGGEFGATTGRARRCGWFDGPATRRAVQISGTTAITLTKLDVLSCMEEIRVCTHYETPAGRLDRIPFDMEVLKHAKPVYETLPGWGVPLVAARKKSDLPPNALAYIQRIEEILESPITMVSIGPDRKQTIRFHEG